MVDGVCSAWNEGGAHKGAPSMAGQCRYGQCRYEVTVQFGVTVIVSYRLMQSPAEPQWCIL